MIPKIRRWIETATGKKIKKFTMLGSWVVRQFQNEYNPTHWHNGHISGVGYLKVPLNQGDYSQNNKRKNQNGKIDFIFGSVKKHWGILHVYKPEKISYSWGFYTSHSTGFFLKRTSAR